ncbi:MAG: hypothetical protein FD131_1048 [Rhodocyclaceae bacterium]|nr:MAG: hypothetical protein FD131_1048 [Rhodocyclaceae bacterium]
MSLIKQLAAALPFMRKKETEEERNTRIVKEFIERTPKGEGSVWDIKLLPHPKPDIQAALLWLMDANPSARQMFGAFYLGTASYQKGFKQKETIELLDAAIAEREALKTTLRQRGFA